MCTVTMLRAGGVLRVVCNRDESRLRPQAHPPFITRAERSLVLTPQDPQGRGTWIAVSDHGLVFALLNVNHDTPARPGATSRGLIIPRVWDCASLDEVPERIMDLPRDTFAPCRLLAADEHCVLELRLTGTEVSVGVHAIDRPLLFTSSSLGDALVDGPRRTLFRQALADDVSALDADAIAARQDAFHRHRWRDRPAVSVHMSRPDACTVSTTTVEVARDTVRMMYEPAHDLEGTPVGLILNRQVHDAPHRTRREYAAV